MGSNECKDLRNIGTVKERYCKEQETTVVCDGKCDECGIQEWIEKGCP